MISLSGYNAWDEGEPNDGGLIGEEGYVEMLVGSGLWNDENGNEDAYVCRLPAAPMPVESHAECPPLVCNCVDGS